MLVLPKDINGWHVFPTPANTINVTTDLPGSLAQARDGFADYVLLPENTAFQDKLDNILGKSGQSPTQPNLITTDNWLETGSPLGRAILDGNVAKLALIQPGDSMSNFAMAGLELTQAGYAGADGKLNISVRNALANNLLFEDLFIHDSGGNSLGSDENDPTVDGMEFHRCSIYQLYQLGGIHTGIFAVNTHNMTISECNLIRNGWHPGTVGSDGILVRNLYTQYSVPGIYVYGTFFAESGSEEQLRAGGFVENCVFDHNRYFINIGLGISSSTQQGNPKRWNGFNSAIINSAFLDSRSFTNGDARASQILYSNIPITRSALFEGNIVSGDHDAGTTNFRGLKIIDKDHDSVTEPNVLDNGINNLKIRYNIIRDIGGKALQWDLTQGVGATYLNNVVEHNYFEVYDPGEFIVKQEGTADITYRNNQYYHTTRQPTDDIFEHNGNLYTFAEWQTNVEPTATWGQRTFPDAGRNIPRYYKEVINPAFVGIDDQAREAMYQLMIDNRKANWDSRYTATAINEWVKQGYGRAVNKILRIAV